MFTRLRTLPVIVFTVSQALVGQDQPDPFAAFVPACTDAMIADTMIDAVGAGVICSCVADESRKANVAGEDMVRATHALNDSARTLRNGPVKRAAAACLNSALGELSRVLADDAVSVQADQRDGMIVPVDYHWTGYWYVPGVSTKVVELSQTAQSPLDLGQDIDCTLGELEIGSALEDGLQVVEASRAVSCLELDVVALDPEDQTLLVTCTHGRKARRATNAQVMFALARPDASDPLGTLTIMCYVTEAN